MFYILPLTLESLIFFIFNTDPESEYRSRYSDWLRIWRPRGRSASPGMGQESSLLQVVKIGSGVHQPSIQWVPGALSSGIKRQGREADHSPPTSAEVKKM
jgi:hypothetical protein